MFKVAQLEVALLFLRIDLVADDFDVGGLSHTAHEEQTSTDEAHLDSDGEVEDDGEQEGDPEHDDIALGILQDAEEAAPTAHIITHDDKHTSQTSHGDILCQRHEEQEDEQQHGSVDDASHGRTTTVVDIRHRSGDGTCRWDTAEDGRRQIGKALGDELSVGIMTVANDTVGHRCRQQRLDGTQYSNSKGRRHKTLDHIPRQLRHLGTGQLVGDAETVADGLDTRHTHILLEQQHANGHHDDGNQRTGEFLQHIIITCNLRPKGNHSHRADAHSRTPPINRWERANIGHPLLDEVAGYRGHRQSKEILYLRSKDGQRNTRGEAHHNGVRNILDDGAQMKHAKHNEEDTRQERGNGKTLEAILLDYAVNNNNERARRATNLNLGTAEDRHDQSGDDGSDDTLLRGHA